MKSLKLKIFLSGGMLTMFLFPFILKAQTLQQTLAQCPLTLQNESITYYMPQQNGGYFQLPPARKPRYVNMLTSPFVQPLQKSVRDTQHEIISQLLVQITRPQLTTEEKELFLRKLAWCVMLQTSFAANIDQKIIDVINGWAGDKNEILQTHAQLVNRLLMDYKTLKSNKN